MDESDASDGPEPSTDDLTGDIIRCAIRVHHALGPGLLERVYHSCLTAELAMAGHRIEREVALPVFYKGVRVEVGYRMDLVVDDRVLIEVKAVETLLPLHMSQVWTYLKLSRLPVGLILNFNTPLLKDGIRRVAGPSAREVNVPEVP